MCATRIQQAEVRDIANVAQDIPPTAKNDLVQNFNSTDEAENPSI